MWKNLFFNENIIKIWFPNGYLHQHIFSLNIKIQNKSLLHNILEFMTLVNRIGTYAWSYDQ